MARRVPLSDVETAIKIIEQDGGVILTGFSKIVDVGKVNSDAAPFIATIQAERASQSLPPETTRCTRLFGRSTTAREIWLQQPPLQKIFNRFLRTVTNPYNGMDDGTEDLATNPILSAAATLEICPGVKEQPLHRDDFIWQQTHAHRQEKYAPGSDVGMGLLVAGVKTNAANGATLFVPGSHLWEHSRLPKMEEAVSAEMDVGEAFLFLASTVHAGGANSTPQSRTVHGFFFCRAYLRPEARNSIFSPTLSILAMTNAVTVSVHSLTAKQENQHLWWTKEEVQQWSVAAQKQAGYLLDHPFLGYCGEKDPIELFRADNRAIK